MNATENDVFGVGFRCFLTQHERVTKKICVHDDAVSLVMMAKDEQVLTELGFEFLNTVGDGLFLNRQGRIHEIDRTHWKGYRHGSHTTQDSTLFEGTDRHERSKRRPW